MFKNLTKKQKLKLFGSFASTALLGIFITLVVIMYFNITYGWFANNRAVNGNNMRVSVETLDANADYYAYIYEAKDSRVHYTGDPLLSSAEEPRIDNLVMQFHDTIFEQRNRYTPAVIRIRLSNIRQQWTSGGIIQVDITRNTNFPRYGTTEGGLMILNDYFSSIMRYTLTQDKTWYDETDPDSDEPDELYFNLDEDLYETVKVMTTNTDSSKTFTSVSIDGEGTITSITKTDSITLQIPYSSSDIVDRHLDIYLYLTYDSSLVNTFEHQAGGIEAGTTAVGIVTTMVNDMTSLAVSFHNN